MDLVRAAWVQSLHMLSKVGCNGIYILCWLTLLSKIGLDTEWGAGNSGLVLLKSECVFMLALLNTWCVRGTYALVMVVVLCCCLVKSCLMDMLLEILYLGGLERSWIWPVWIVRFMVVAVWGCICV